MRTLMLILIMLLSFVLNACGKAAPMAVDPSFAYLVETEAMDVSSPEICDFEYLDATTLELQFCTAPATVESVRYYGPEIDMNFTYVAGSLVITGVPWGGPIWFTIRGSK